MDPLADPSPPLAPLTAVHDAARRYLDALDGLPALDPAAQPLLDDLDGPLPAAGVGAVAAVDRLVRVGTAAATHSSGPNFYHFVIGGSTPAAMGADWLVSLLDQERGGPGVVELRYPGSRTSRCAGWWSCSTCRRPGAARWWPAPPSPT